MIYSSLETDYNLLKAGYKLKDIDNMYMDEHIYIGTLFKLFESKNSLDSLLQTLNATNPSEDFLNDVNGLIKQLGKLTKRGVEKA